jgi:hypothetical protein
LTKIFFVFYLQMSFSCGTFLLSGEKRNDFCNKPAYTYIVLHNNTIYLCKYHTTRYKKQQRIAVQIEVNMQLKIITIPDFGVCNDYNIKETFKTRRSFDYLPLDCWGLILNYLPESGILLSKFVCKDWLLLLREHKTSRIDFGEEFKLYGCYMTNYMYELPYYYGVSGINIDNIKWYIPTENFIWLINNGAKFGDQSLITAIHMNDYDVVKLLIEKKCRFTSSFHLYTKIIKINDNIIKLLVDNNIMTPTETGELVARYLEMLS